MTDQSSLSESCAEFCVCELSFCTADTNRSAQSNPDRIANYSESRVCALDVARERAGDMVEWPLRDVGGCARRTMHPRLRSDHRRPSCQTSRSAGTHPTVREISGGRNGRVVSSWCAFDTLAMHQRKAYMKVITERIVLLSTHNGGTNGGAYSLINI